MPKYAEEILAAVTELQRHPTAEQVFMEMKKEHPSIAIGTVYKHLNALAEEGPAAPHHGVGFAGPVRPNGTARSLDLQPVRENRGRSPAGYAEPDRTGAGTGDPLV